MTKSGKIFLYVGPKTGEQYFEGHINLKNAEWAVVDQNQLGFEGPTIIFITVSEIRGFE